MAAAVVSRWILMLAALWLAPVGSLSADDEPGLALYKQHCARCHGASGEGNPDEYEEPLTGKRSVGQLARLIGKTMPSDDPGILSKQQNEEVAFYIYNAFYSPTAQARNAPPRIALSRLTVRQYRQEVADLIGTFRNDPPAWGDERGLKAEYYKLRRFRGGDRVLQRVDPQIGFDFGKESPDKEKIEDPHEFSIRWEGSVQAPETGLYTFTLRTDQAARFWLNDLSQPLVDAWVKSGDDIEHTASIFLIEGRAYPLKVEFSKAKQGVDDSDKQKKKPPVKPALIKLEWTRPGRIGEVIPSRYFSTARFPETFAISAPFPPDDRSIGYERGTSVSKAWEEATTEGAIETADYVQVHLNQLAGTRLKDSDHVEKLKNFALRFAERAFRRPLNDELRALYVDRQFEAAPNPEAAVKRVILLVMKSPRFLYPGLNPESSENDQYAVATRVALELWDSLPDKPLLNAARDGKLSTPDEVARQAERMMNDLKARAKLRTFFLHYLALDRGTEPAKDAEHIPQFRRDPRLRPEGISGPVPRRGGLERQPRLPSPLSVRRDLSQWPVGEVLRGRPARKRPVPESPAQSRGPGGRSVASLPHGELRVHLHDIPDPSGRVPAQGRSGPSAPAAAGRLHPPGARPAPGPEHP